MHMGLSEKAGKFLKWQLTSFQHFILLGEKQSTRSFCNTLRVRIHVTGQETRWSPIIWLVEKIFIIDVMDKNHPWKVFIIPTGKCYKADN